MATASFSRTSRVLMRRILARNFHTEVLTNQRQLKIHQHLNIHRQIVRMSTSNALLFDKAYVNGQWIPAKSGKTFEVLNPSTGAVVGKVPDMSAEDTNDAIKIAFSAFQSWRDSTPKLRSELLKKWHQLVQENSEELANIMTSECGKPLAEARGEMAYSMGFIEWYAEEAKRIYGEVIPSNKSTNRLFVIKQPVGVSGMITPWNFPSAMITRKACAALAAGCTVVLKPSEDTPLSALALCDLAEKAGFPPGVINIVTASRENASQVGGALCESPLVNALSFTGSSAVGKILLKQCASTVKKVSMELGGNAAFIVFDSADIDHAVTGLIACKFRNAGQTCICPNRVFVQEAVYDSFLEKMQAAMSKLRVGDGFSKDTNVGPLINSRAVDKVSEIVDDAVSKGGRVLFGGSRHSQGSNFYEPTLVADATADMKCSYSEIFGPLAPVYRFKTEEEVVALANIQANGLASYLFSRNLGQIWRVAEKLDVGIVGVNEGAVSSPETPFGGFKESGLGREGGKYGIEDFLEVKFINIGGL